jgi:hypothetical protein
MKITEALRIGVFSHGGTPVSSFKVSPTHPRPPLLRFHIPSCPLAAAACFLYLDRRRPLPVILYPAPVALPLP